MTAIPGAEIGSFPAFGAMMGSNPVRGLQNVKVSVQFLLTMLMRLGITSLTRKVGMTSESCC